MAEGDELAREMSRQNNEELRRVRNILEGQNGGEGLVAKVTKQGEMLTNIQTEVSEIKEMLEGYIQHQAEKEADLEARVESLEKKQEERNTWLFKRFDRGTALLVAVLTSFCTLLVQLAKAIFGG